MTRSRLTASLADVVAALWARPQPSPEVEAKARLLVLDTIGCWVAGAAAPELVALGAAFPGPIALPGLPPLSPEGATLIATAAACWDEACEGLARAHGRPGLHCIAAVLARALEDGRTLGAALDAIVAGFEVGGRLGEVLRIRSGMHVDGTWGTFGAAAALARLAGFDGDRAMAALNAVACGLPHSLYLPIRRGAMNRNLYSGQSGIRAREVVAAIGAGIAAPADGLDEVTRLMFGLDPDTIAVAAPDLDLVLEGYLKPFAAVRHVHYPAAAAIAWRDDHGAPTPDGITGIEIAIYSEAITYCGNRAPACAIQAQFSLSYGTAWTLLTGDLGPDAFRAPALSDPSLRRLESLVVLIPDPARDGAGRRGATLRVETNGYWREAVADLVLGDPAKPMRRADAVAKFQRFAGPRLGAGYADRLVRALLDGPRDTPMGKALNGP